MEIKVQPFGQIGKTAYSLFTLKNSADANVTITDFGGIVTSLTVPDKKGTLNNVVLGFDSVDMYKKNSGYLGALIGPVGNRIGGAAFTFEGHKYTLTPNERNNLLHSGDFGFHDVHWLPECELNQDKAYLTLRHDFPHIENGFPGALSVTVVYTFTETNELRIDYRVESDSPSFVSPTNHTYFNISGTDVKHIKPVTRQSIRILADKYSFVDEGCIPLRNAPVAGTPFDLNDMTNIGEMLEKYEEKDAQMQIGHGYDHNFVLSDAIDSETGLRLAAEVQDARSGRTMKVYTDMPCVQFYAANMLKRYNPSKRRWYMKRQALCLETQFAPDSIHHIGEDGFSIGRVDDKHPFTSSTVYAFGVRK